MTSLTSNPSPTPAPEAAKPALLNPRRSWLHSVIVDVLSRPGARIGAIWIAFVAFLAAFSPVIASSHPFYMKTADGSISSPWWNHLTPTDITLFIMLPVMIVLFFWRKAGVGVRFGSFWLLFIAVMVITSARLSALTVGIFFIVPVAVCFALLKDIPTGKRAAIFAGISLVLLVASQVNIVEPQAIDYSKYREMQAAKQLDSAWFAPLPYSPSDRLRDQPEARLKPPPFDGHPLGTENNGSDVLSIIIHASRIALTIGFISTGIAVTIGVVIGGLMGYFAKAFDLIGMRLVEIFEAIPQLYLLLTFAAFFPGNPEIFGVVVPRIYMMMAIIGLTGWTGYARFTRAEFLKLRKQDFVQAAIACGLPLRSVLFKHMLPNGIAPVLVGASFGVASAILTESFLSFLGLGLIDEPSWGGLLKQSVSETGRFTWWIATFPGLAIFLTVFSYNLIGEALRDAIDPHTQRLNQS